MNPLAEHVSQQAFSAAQSVGSPGAQPSATVFLHAAASVLQRWVSCFLQDLPSFSWQY